MIKSILTGHERQFPSTYAVFHLLTVSNDCGNLGTGWDSVTVSFTPGALSTFAPFTSTAKIFDFANLPCPPAGLYVEPGNSTTLDLPHHEPFPVA